MYKAFDTKASLEKEGVWVEYGEFRVKVGYAGGANKKYVGYAEKKFKPLRRAIATDALDDKRSRDVMIDIYARTIVFGWQVLVNKDADPDKDESWKDGIGMPDGSIGEVTPENIIIVFKKFRPLFQDIMTQADSIANYRAEILEEESGN